MSAPAILLAEEVEVEDQFLANRRKGIGGSDVAAIVGLSPWKNAFDVYVEKRDLVEKDKSTVSMRVGRAVERAIAQEYSDLTSRPIIWQGDVQHVDRDEDWRRFHPDALLTYEDGGLETKHVGARQAARYGPSGTDMLPHEHVLQCVWAMSITKRQFWDLAAWLGPKDLRIYTMLRDVELEETLIDRCRRFWQENVLAGVPPDVSPEQADTDFFKKRFPEAMGGVRQATEEEIVYASSLRLARRAFKEAEGTRHLVESELKLSIGEAEGIQAKGIDGFRITWKNDRPKVKVDWQAVARELASTHPGSTVLAEAVAQFTTTVPGSRRFLPRFEGSDEEEEG
jgi:predicted phage-related endonuclease